MCFVYVCGGLPALMLSGPPIWVRIRGAGSRFRLVTPPGSAARPDHHVSPLPLSVSGSGRDVWGAVASQKEFGFLEKLLVSVAA